MQFTRTQVLTGILFATLLLAGAILANVIWTVFFGVTVAYMLVPLVRRLRERGVSTWWASIVASIVGTAGLLSILVLVVSLVYRRRTRIIAFLQSVPETITIDGFGFGYVFDTGVVLESAAAIISSLAFDVARGLPTLGFKLTLFGFVVFGLLIGHEPAEDAFMTAIPHAYHDIAVAFATRIRDTLYAIYVIQAATGAATFVLALPVFVVLGYDIPLTLAFISGVLQFVPIIGPSVLLGILGLYHLAIGDLVAAALVVGIGGLVIAWLPDILVRPRLSRRAGNLPGTLYFIGFVGGLLTVGPIGIIAGPLAVALVAEAVTLLASESE